MRSYMLFAVWTLLAGAGIPLIGVLNSGVARGVGNPYAATAIMFAIATVAALGVARNPDAESADPSRDVDAPKSALSLIRFGGAPAILISGDDPRAA